MEQTLNVQCPTFNGRRRWQAGLFTTPLPEHGIRESRIADDGRPAFAQGYGAVGGGQMSEIGCRVSDVSGQGKPFSLRVRLPPPLSSFVPLRRDEKLWRDPPSLAGASYVWASK